MKIWRSIIVALSSLLPVHALGPTGLFIPELKELLVAIPRKGNQDAFVQIYQVQ